MQKELPLPHPNTRFSNCSLSTQNLPCFPQRAAGQLSPASLQPQHLLISSGAHLLLLGSYSSQAISATGIPSKPWCMQHTPHTDSCLDTPPVSTCVFSVLSRESWKARPPHVQLWIGSEEKSSTSPFSGFPRALLLTWRAWWLALAATPLNLHSPNPNKRSVSGRVSTPWQPWTLGGAEGGTLHWSLQQRLWEPLPGLLISQPRQKGREPAASRGRRRGGPV